MPVRTLAASAPNTCAARSISSRSTSKASRAKSCAAWTCALAPVDAGGRGDPAEQPRDQPRQLGAAGHRPGLPLRLVRWPEPLLRGATNTGAAGRAVDRSRTCSTTSSRTTWTRPGKAACTARQQAAAARPRRRRARASRAARRLRQSQAQLRAGSAKAALARPTMRSRSVLRQAQQRAGDKRTRGGAAAGPRRRYQAHGTVGERPASSVWCTIEASLTWRVTRPLRQRRRTGAGCARRGLARRAGAAPRDRQRTHARACCCRCCCACPGWRSGRRWLAAIRHAASRRRAGSPAGRARLRALPVSARTVLADLQRSASPTSRH